MSLFHDEEHGPSEPVPGLPEPLPEGERVLWQGRPDTLGLVFGPFRLRWVAGYFILASAWRLSAMAEAGAAEMSEAAGLILAGGAAATAVIVLLAWATSQAALFTITTQRVAIRHGVAIRKYVNAPFAQMSGAKLKRRSLRVGDIALELDGAGGAGWLHLWPFARPFRLFNAQPMLRSVKDADEVARILANAVKARDPASVRVELREARDTALPPMDAAIGAA